MFVLIALVFRNLSFSGIYSFQTEISSYDFLYPQLIIRMEKNKHSLLCLLIVLQCGMALGQKTSNVDELLNWCLDARHHKKLPGPEGDLFKQVHELCLGI